MGQDFRCSPIEQLAQASGHVLFAARKDHILQHPVAPDPVPRFRVARGGKHLLVEGGTRVVGQLLPGRIPHFIRVVVDAHRHVGDQGRHRAVGPSCAFLHRRQSHVPQVLTGTYPTYGSVGHLAAQPKRPAAQGRGHHRHIRGRRAGQGGVAVVLFAVKVHSPLPQQGLNHLDVFPQVGQGCVVFDAKHRFDTDFMAGAKSQPEAPRGQLGDHLGLLHRDDGMTRVGGNNAGAEQNSLGGGSGGGKGSQGVRPSSAGGEPRRGDAQALQLLNPGYYRPAVTAHCRYSNSLLSHCDYPPAS